MENDGFRAGFGTGRFGFHMTIHGWTISVQWGAGNYCDNHHAAPTHAKSASQTAEIAIWRAEGEHSMVQLGTDTVRGYVTPAQVGTIIGQLATGKLTSESQIRACVVATLEE